MGTVRQPYVGHVVGKAGAYLSQRKSVDKIFYRNATVHFLPSKCKNYSSKSYGDYAGGTNQCSTFDLYNDQRIGPEFNSNESPYIYLNYFHLPIDTFLQCVAELSPAKSLTADLVPEVVKSYGGRTLEPTPR